MAASTSLADAMFDTGHGRARQEREMQRAWAGYGLVLVIALAAASWAPGLWRLIPAVVLLVLLVVVSPRLSRRFRDRERHVLLAYLGPIHVRGTAAGARPSAT